MPLIECEFPALASLNKLGDGSLRSTIEAEDANIKFVQALVQGLKPFDLVGPDVVLVAGSAASNSFLKKVQKVKGVKSVYSLKNKQEGEELMQALALTKETVCVYVTPSSRTDYQSAKRLAEGGSCKAVVIINAFAKDQKSIPSSATMGYFLKPLTYNSQIAGYLIRSYPGPWTVLDAMESQVLGTFGDDEILVRGTNTPDLRGAGRLVQKCVDERAIRARQQ